MIAGIDEAGRGPMAGPVVSAAVILKERARLPGLNDSKLLNPGQREILFEQILQQCIDFSITAVSHKVVDQMNILQATKYANYLCIQYLKEKPNIVLIDGRDKQFLEMPFKTIIKGDQKVRSIAAASILAKVTRDKIMDKYSEEFEVYGFGQHKGYGTRMHRKNLTKYGPCEIHRKSFTFKA